MNTMIYKIDTISDDFIKLYMNCFHNDIIYNSRDSDLINNKDIMMQMFNYYLNYGIILVIEHRNKIIGFLATLDIDSLKTDKEAYEFFFNKNKYPEMRDFMVKYPHCDYIVLVAIDKSFRHEYLATRLVKHYIRYYNKHKPLVADIDDQYSLKMFKRLGFEITKLANEYYLGIKR